MNPITPLVLVPIIEYLRIMENPNKIVSTIESNTKRSTINQFKDVVPEADKAIG